MEFLKQIENSKSDIDFVFSATLISFADSSKNGKYHVNLNLIKNLSKQPALLFERNLIGSPSVTIIRKNSNVTFDKNLKWVVDIDFYIQSLLNTNFIFINEVLINSVNNADHSVTNDCINKEVEVFEYIYLYKKINISNKVNEKYVTFFKNLFKRYDVRKKELVTLMKGIKPDKTIRLALLKKRIGF
jgi:hypothetical protein